MNNIPPSRRLHAVLYVLLAASLAAMPGCAEKREPQTQQYLLQLRQEEREHSVKDTQQKFVHLLERIHKEQQAYQAGEQPNPPVIDILIISGGGDWGAFGSGYLKGWKQVPADDPLAFPEFDAVTGVSTGALIAPFAFVGTDESIETIVHLYRNPQKDWVKDRWPLYFLPSNLSFAEVPGLEREVRTQVTLEVARQIADEGREGRLLMVNTTNLDDASPRVFDLVDEAELGVETGNLDRLHKVMLASAGIPGAFPYREIDGQMYVDGGVTANIIYGGRLSEDQSLQADWQRLYPDQPIPKVRYWVIFNNQFQAPPTVVDPRWPPIVTRALHLSTRSATLTALRHLLALAEITQLKRGAEVEVRIIAIPNDWTAPEPGTFNKTTMDNLADLGLKMGADTTSWHTGPLPP